MEADWQFIKTTFGRVGSGLSIRAYHRGFAEDFAFALVQEFGFV